MSDEKKEECPVCFDRLSRVIVARPPCGHEVCLPCLMALRKRDCVLCRADLSPLFPPPRSPRVTLHVGGDTLLMPPAPPPLRPPSNLLQSIRLAMQERDAERPMVVLHD